MPEAKESNTPRLCVCDSIAGCFAARVFSIGKTVYVYRTRKPMGAVKPVGVWDAGITGERWLVPPVPLILVSAVHPFQVDDIQWSALTYVAKTGEPFNVALRSAQLVAAIETLGGTKAEREVVAFLKSRFKFDDPHDFILAAMKDRLDKAAKRRAAS